MSNPRPVGPPDVHDARVTAIEATGGVCRVRLSTYEGTPLEFEFDDAEISAADAVGMFLYSLVELDADSPRRRFEFTDWDEGPRRLVVVAVSGRWRRSAQTGWAAI